MLFVESLTQEPYATYVQHHVLDPLNMSHTRLEPGLAVGHRFSFGVPLPDPMSYTSDFASVHGGCDFDRGGHEPLPGHVPQWRVRGQARRFSQRDRRNIERGVSDVTISEGDRIVPLAYGMGWATGVLAALRRCSTPA